MERKAVFFDIDGTLSDEMTFQIPESTKEALTKAGENGHLMFINTGRTACTLEKQIKALGLDGYVCGCGTNVIFHGEDLFYDDLPAPLRQRIINASFECKVENVLEGKNGIYFPETLQDPYIRGFKARYEQQGFPVSLYHPGDLVPFEKMALWYFPESDIESFKNQFKGELDFIQRADNFLEIVPLGYSKATGIKTLIDHLDIPWEDCISIGDSTNDLPMLEYTKESVAMGNSNPLLFDKVTYITTDINDNGIYNALQHFHLI